MSSAGLWSMTRVAFVLVAGASFGFGLSSLNFGNLPTVIWLLAIAGFAEWLGEVKLRPVGAFTLRPVVAFLGLWHLGTGPLMVVGLVPLLLMGLLRRGAQLPDALASGGRDALGFWMGSFLHAGILSWILPSSTVQGSVEVASRVGSLLAFWTIQILLNGIEITQSLGIRYRAGIRHLLKQMSPHIAILAASAVALSYVFANLGLIVMILAAVVLIEAYYPQKLLGEQAGVLLTSLQMMAQAVDLKDPYTSNHSQRVSAYAVRIARAMGLAEDEVERIRIGGLMHDIGKIGISGRIIRKPGKLTPEETALMNRHSSVSADIIEHLEILGESATMVRHHHEHCDGSGYPDRLRDEEIPLGSRIILVADAFDALTTDRPYRKGASRAEAVAVIRENAGTQFDRRVVDALERVQFVLLIEASSKAA